MEDDRRAMMKTIGLPAFLARLEQIEREVAGIRRRVDELIKKEAESDR